MDALPQGNCAHPFLIQLTRSLGIHTPVSVGNFVKSQMVTKMTDYKDTEVSKESDLKAFAGKEFSDEPCGICQVHLAIVGANSCMMCASVADSMDIHKHPLEMPTVVTSAEPAMDGELLDPIHGLGSMETW